jgi:hypothetical protein
MRYKSSIAILAVAALWGCSSKKLDIADPTNLDCAAINNTIFVELAQDKSATTERVKEWIGRIPSKTDQIAVTAFYNERAKTELGIDQDGGAPAYEKHLFTRMADWAGGISSGQVKSEDLQKVIGICESRYFPQK